MTEEPQPQPQPGGVVISGGTVQIGALAQGSHARASNRQVVQAAEPQLSREQREDLAGLMRELLATLRRYESELADQAAVEAAVDGVSAELDQEHPDRSRIRRLLDKVAAAAGPVADIVAAVATAQRAITGMG